MDSFEIDGNCNNEEVIALIDIMESTLRNNPELMEKIIPRKVYRFNAA